VARETEWTDPARAERWLARRSAIPGQQEAARVIFRDVIAGRSLRRILDLGTGDGRVIALLQQAFPGAEAVGLDVSPPLLEAARERFKDEPRTRLVEHDLHDPLPRDLGQFDLVISVQAIHHLPDARKQTLYREVFDHVAAGGVFCNVDLVALPTPALFERAMEAYGLTPEDQDPDDQPAPVGVQLAWLREGGFSDVDVYWKWLAGAILVGERVA
jgi:tRNA (cmo5U34)-methyltransferase